MPALVAPGLPIASVPTGTPPGIWTMESSESRPWSAALCTGTPEDGKHGVRRDHAWQVRGAARARDDHLDAARLCALRELRHPQRRAVRRDDLLLIGHAEPLEHLDGVGHRLPVGRRAHDHGYKRIGHRQIVKFYILISMEWLNYHHLLYFWTVARVGTIARASEELRLAQPTISGQIRALEVQLGEKLFQRSGRNLVLTEMGRVVYRYADDIFALGRELMDTLKDRPTGRPMRFQVGVADEVSKMIAYRLLEPALRLPDPVRIVCRDGAPERLIADLATHALDLVIADAPIASTVKVKAFSHPLGETPVSVFGTTKLAAAYRKGFPRSLDGAPFLLPTDGKTLRRALDQWFDQQGLRPRIVAEIDDSALWKTFGEAGAGLFVAPTAIEKEVARQYGVTVVGRIDAIRERYFAISVERRLKHPAVVAISAAANETLAAMRKKRSAT